jgi:uncharacterized membrane protein YgcG
VVVKTYTFFSNTNLKLSANDKSVTIDYFSTISNAILSWKVTSGFKSISLNGQVINSSSASGSANVASKLKNGQKNVVHIDNDFWSNPSATVTLQVEGYLVTAEMLLVQNQTFVSAFNNKQITEQEFKNSMNFQNLVAQSMLQNGMITSSEYQQLIKVFDDVFPQGDNSGGSGGNNDNSGGDSGGGSWWDNLFGGGSSGGSSGGGGSGGASQSFWSAKNVALGGVVVFVLLLVITLVLRGGKK